MTNSIFSGLLSVSMVIDQIGGVVMNDQKYSCFVELQNFPNVSSADSNSCLVSETYQIQSIHSPSITSSRMTSLMLYFGTLLWSWADKG